ncbi:histidine kinase dimerization/phosphoacceptor domain -containing protein [Celeribacter sp.]|uniref:histidine kinase dimerization/phosphoacceptor domain -containing protein n=1 Tax=Celeribacter sp. TaxID=1890673 RepID=UPI003A90ACE1
MTDAPPAPHSVTIAPLDTLAGLNLLNAEREEMFDDVAELLSDICEMPVSFVSFIGGDTQWFKAACGLTDPSNTVEDALCTHVLTGDGMVEIPDLRLDPRTKGLAPVTHGGARFYAGVPLRTSEGALMGTVCVIGMAPARLTPLQRKSLTTLAAQVGSQIALRRAVKNAELLRHEVDHRVKNSLQSVAAQIRLKARASHHDTTREALKQVETRIQTVAALHEAMYRTSASNRIDMADYARKLVHIIAAIAPKGVTLTADLPALTLTSEQASAVAVIFNEFATNSFKHGFPDGRTGAVSMTGKMTPGGAIRLTFSDDGVGFDGAATGSGLGLRVIEASAAQLGGTWTPVACDRGVAATLDIAPLS